MKTIRTCLCIIALSFIATPSSAQYFTIGIQGGFSAGLPDATYWNYSTLRYSNAWGYVVDDIQGLSKSLGRGVPVDIEIGYAGGIGVSFGISAGYQHGLPASISYGIKYYSSEDLRTATFQGRYYHVSPYIGMYRRWKRWGFTAKLHPVFAFASFERKTEVQREPEPNGTDGDRYLFIRKYTGPVTVGFKGSFDIEHVFKSGKQALFFGLSYTHLSFSPKRSGVTTYELNGKDDLASLSTVNREADYSNNQAVTYNFNPDGSINWNQDENQPFKTTRFDIPFDALSFNMGIRFYFRRGANTTTD